MFPFLIPFTDSSFIPPLIYAVMGSSRDIAIGPVAVVSLLLGTLLQSEIDPIANPVDYRRLAFTATFFAGITQATLGVLRYATLTRRDCINLPSTNVYDCLVHVLVATILY